MTDKIVDKAVMEKAIAQCVMDWAIANQWELVALKKQVDAIKDGLLHRNAMSRDGNMLHKAEIPLSLYSMMQKRIDRNWTKDRWVLNTFLRIFQVGLVNKSSQVRV